jgi:hypothetical protein
MKRLVRIGIVAVALSGLVACSKTEMSSSGRQEARRDSQLASGKVDASHGAVADKGDKGSWSEDRMRTEAKATLAAIVQSALTENGLMDVTQHLSRVNRQPIDTAELAADTQLSNSAELNQQIAQFQAKWHDLYGQDFNVISRPQVAFGDPAIHVQPGQNLEDAQLAAERIPADDSEPPEAATGVASPNELVRVQFPEFHEVPELTVDLRQAPMEPSATTTAAASNYRLLVPNSMDAKALQENLLNCLKSLETQQERWPESSAEAERIVAQKILAAIEGSAAHHEEAQPSQQQQQPQPQQQEPGLGQKD